MRFLTLLLILMPFQAKAAFLLHYGLNYSSEVETADTEYDKKRTFHKVYLGASVNNKKTVFFGWNVNKYSTSLTVNGGDETAYSMLEMGPKVLWFFNENYNWYLSAEWNPYAKGTRDKAAQTSDISGSSLSAGIGYRYRISRLWGVGAGIHYHSLGMKEETVDNTKADISDKLTNIMPMIEFSVLTK